MKKSALSVLQKFTTILPPWVWFGVAFILVHLPQLTALPVFADEAIYIRWAQLFADEPYRFAFFSMADGKPPLFIWILSLFLRPFADPLFAGRLLSVGIGLGTMFVIGRIARLLTGRKSVEYVAMFLVLFTPFWWFYHRMSLMDGLLTLCISLSFYFAARIAIFCQRERGIAYDMVPNVLLLGASFGGALLTKTPALFAIPIIALTPFFSLIRVAKNSKSVRMKLKESIVMIGIGGVIGCLVFLLLRISPFFGALFTRGGDFTFSSRELLLGEWKYVLLESFPREIVWLSSYLTYSVIFCALSGIIFKRSRKTVIFLWGCAFLFAAPLIVFGRVLYPRYFLPTAPFLTLAAAIGFDEFVRKKSMRLLCWLFFIAFCWQALSFLSASVTTVAHIPFVPIDRMQYLEEWSAGFGNAQVRDFIRNRYQEEEIRLGGTRKPSLTVLTEGSFGTLPDGLLMYFWGRQQLDGVEIHGIGVGPSTIPSQYVERAKSAEVYYVVNSHRYKIEHPDLLEKVFEVDRPGDAPKLLFFKVSGQ